MAKRKSYNKIIALILAVLCLMTCFTACGGTEKEESVESSTKDSNQITTYEELYDKKIGVLAGSIFAQVAMSYNLDQELAYFDTYPDALQALMANKIDAYIVEEPTIYLQQIANPGKLIKLDKELMSEDTGFILSKDNTELLEQINNVLAKLKAEGVYDMLANKWVYTEDTTAAIDSELLNYEGPNGTLRVCVNTTNVGFDEIRNEQYAGYEFELILTVAKELGYTCEFTSTKFPGLIASVTSGKADIAMGVITITDERKQSVNFTDPVFSCGVYAAVLDVSGEGGEVTETTFWENVKSSFTKTFIAENRWKMVLSGLLTTLLISVAAVVLGSIIGFFFSFALRSEKKISRGLSKAVTSILSGMPIVVLLMLLYYVLFAKVNMSAVVVAIIGFAIDFCCSTAGILNTGIAGVSDGQKRAASALGYNKMQVFTKIVFPQATSQMFDQYKASIVNLVKSTSIAGYITVEDLTRISDIIRSRTYEAFFPLIATAVIYFIITRLLIWVLGLVGNVIDPEKRSNSEILKGVNKENKIPEGTAFIQRSNSQNRDVLIELKHLEKAYTGVTPLKDVNAEIRRGDVIVIIGPSGTGKSTLLNCINQLDPPTNGEVWIEGVLANNTKCNLEKLRQKVGMVFQSFNLFEHKTVIENVMMAPMDLQGVDKQQAYDTAMDLLAKVGLGERAMYYPNALSGGQKQRVAIARTLAMNPDIILLDEPTSALDPASIGEVKSVVKSLSKMGQTMLIVTHDMSFARDVANRVFYMDEGIIYDDDTPEVIFDNPVKDKTRAFIKRKKAFVQTISSEQFDYIKARNDLLEFGQKNWWTRDQINRANAVFEEVCQSILIPHYEDKICAEFIINYFEKDNIFEININYQGEEYNAIIDADELQQKILKNAYPTCEYSFDGVNHLIFK